MVYESDITEYWPWWTNKEGSQCNTSNDVNFLLNISFIENFKDSSYISANIWSQVSAAMYEMYLLY